MPIDLFILRHTVVKSITRVLMCKLIERVVAKFLFEVRFQNDSDGSRVSSAAFEICKCIWSYSAIQNHCFECGTDAWIQIKVQTRKTCGASWAAPMLATAQLKMVAITLNVRDSPTRLMRHVSRFRVTGPMGIVRAIKNRGSQQRSLIGRHLSALLRGVYDKTIRMRAVDEIKKRLLSVVDGDRCDSPVL